MLLDCAHLIAVILGVMLVQFGPRLRLGWHGHRGLSFLQLGLRELHGHFDTTRQYTSQRSEKLFVAGIPLGCLGSLVVLGGGIAGLVFVAVSFLRSNGATQGAFERLQAHPQAIDALGEPIKMGWLLSGSINIDGPSGDADLSIPVSGPRNSGTLYVEAEKQAGEWDYQILELAIDGSSERINLLPAFTLRPKWQLPEASLLQSNFATDLPSFVEVGFLPSASF